MSLAVVIDVSREDATRRVTAGLGLLMTGVLFLAALEQSWDLDGGRWWLPLGCAVASAAWCLFLCRQQRRRQPLRLQVTAEGSLRLLCIDSAEAADAVVLRAWSLGRLIVLRAEAQFKVDPGAPGSDVGQSVCVFGSAEFLFVLARGSFDENRWHALRRWLVWYRRARRNEAITA